MAKHKMTRLQLFLMGKGPTIAVQRRLVKESQKGKASK